jgi:hypothetical protein
MNESLEATIWTRATCIQLLTYLSLTLVLGVSIGLELGCLFFAFYASVPKRNNLLQACESQVVFMSLRRQQF